MAQTNINIRMDEELKKQFDNFCSDVGMSMTTAFCIFAKTVVRQQRTSFEISSDSDLFYSFAYMARLNISKKISKSNSNTDKIDYKIIVN